MQLLVLDIIKLFRVTEKTVNEWIEKKGMPSFTVDKQRRFNHIELLEWALENKIKLYPEILTLNGKGDTSLLSNALKKGGIYYGVSGKNRSEVLRSVVDLMPLPSGTDKKSVSEMLIARERLESTAIGHGIALPHVRSPIVLPINDASITLCFLKHPVDFHAMDHKPVSILFTMVSPSVRLHLLLLSRLASCLQDVKFMEYLRQEDSKEKLIAELIIVETKLSTKDLQKT